MTSRRHTIITTLFFCLGLISLAVAQSQSKVWPAPEKLILTPNTTETVEIHVQTGVDMAGAEVHVRYNPALIDVIDADTTEDGVQIAHGDFLAPDFVAQNVVDPEAGTIDYAIACMPVDKAASGSGVLARVTFSAIGQGETEFEITSAILADKAGQSIEVETGRSIVVINRSGPSPAVWALIAVAAIAVTAGLVALVVRAIKSR